MFRGLFTVVFITFIFTLGWFSGIVYTSVSTGNLEKPLSLGSLVTGNIERFSPGDHILEKDIHVYHDRVIINLEDASWSAFTDTNSMDPLLDANSNGIEVKPKSAKELKKGDVIAFKTPYANGIIIHRIIDMGHDQLGWYAKTKGDNNPSVDPGKVRFEDITGVLVGIIY